MPTLSLDTRPEPLEIDLPRTGLPADRLQAVLEQRRRRGLCKPSQGDALCLMRARPELKGQLLVEGTWDFQLVEAVAPRDSDIVVLKTRYSGFAGTQLDSVLRAREIRYLVFIGIATNVCAESTLRDAYFHEYWPLLVTDAALQAGPPEAHNATVSNVESFFGWTIDTHSLIEALGRSLSASSQVLRVCCSDRLPVQRAVGDDRGAGRLPLGITLGWECRRPEECPNSRSRVP